MYNKMLTVLKINCDAKMSFFIVIDRHITKNYIPLFDVHVQYLQEFV